MPNKKRYKGDIALKMRSYDLKAKYGISWDEYVALYNKQEGTCQICSGFINLIADKSDRFHTARVDHCHTTGKVRGLLCDYCNKGLGFFRDNPVNLQKAIDYLEI